MFPFLIATKINWTSYYTDFIDGKLTWSQMGYSIDSIMQSEFGQIVNDLFPVFQPGAKADSLVKFIDKHANASTNYSHYVQNFPIKNKQINLYNAISLFIGTENMTRFQDMAKKMKSGIERFSKELTGFSDFLDAIDVKYDDMLKSFDDYLQHPDTFTANTVLDLIHLNLPYTLDKLQYLNDYANLKINLVQFINSIGFDGDNFVAAMYAFTDFMHDQRDLFDNVKLSKILEPAATFLTKSPAISYEILVNVCHELLQFFNHYLDKIDVRVDSLLSFFTKADFDLVNEVMKDVTGEEDPFVRPDFVKHVTQMLTDLKDNRIEFLNIMWRIALKFYTGKKPKEAEFSDLAVIISKTLSSDISFFEYSRLMCEHNQTYPSNGEEDECTSQFAQYRNFFKAFNNRENSFTDMVETVFTNKSSRSYKGLQSIIRFMKRFFDSTTTIAKAFGGWLAYFKVFIDVSVEMLNQKLPDALATISAEYYFIETKKEFLPQISQYINIDNAEEIYNFLNHKCDNDNTITFTKALTNSISILRDYIWDNCNLIGFNNDLYIFKLLDTIINVISPRIVKKGFSPYEIGLELPYINDLVTVVNSILDAYNNDKEKTLTEIFKAADTNPLNVVESINNLEKLDLSKNSTLKVEQDLIGSFIVDQNAQSKGILRNILNVPEFYKSLLGFNDNTPLGVFFDAVAFPDTDDFFKCTAFKDKFFDEKDSPFNTKTMAENLPGEFGLKMLDVFAVINQGCLTDSFSLADFGKLAEKLKQADSAAVDYINGGGESDGFPTWAIVVIVVAAVVIIAVVVVIVVLKMPKTTGKRMSGRPSSQHTSSFQQFDVFYTETFQSAPIDE